MRSNWNLLLKHVLWTREVSRVAAAGLYQFLTELLIFCHIGEGTLSAFNNLAPANGIVKESKKEQQETHLEESVSLPLGLSFFGTAVQGCSPCIGKSLG